MRNDHPNDPHNDPQKQGSNLKQVQERSPAKPSIHAQDKGSKGKKGKSSPSRTDDRNPGRSH